MTGAYLKVSVAVEEQKTPLPGCRVQGSDVKLMLLSVLLPVPVSDAVLVSLYSQVVPATVYFQSVPVRVTWSLELADILPGVITAVVTLPRLDVQVCGVPPLPMASPVNVSVAVPGDAGLLLTDAEKFDAVQVMSVNPETHTKLVPDARPAVSTSPAATSVPPTLPTVSTSDALAGAAVAPRVATNALARHETRMVYLRTIGSL
jgi:hypothetical protein